MGYVFITIALLAGCAKGYCGKRISGYTESFHAAIGANILRMILWLAFAVSKPEKQPADKPRGNSISVFILVMAICLFLNSYFKTLAAEHLSSVLLYPLNQGSTLILSSIMSAVLFREKLTAKAILGMLTAFVGLLVINLL